MNNVKGKILKCIIAIVLIIAIALIINYYFKNTKSENIEYTQIDTTSTNLEVVYNERELSGEWSEYTGKITFADSKVAIEGNGVKSSGNSITIYTAGTYYITGNIEDGNILIEAKESDEVQLVLNNCSITSKEAAPINGIECSKLTITLAENSENILTDSSSYTVFTDTESGEPDGTLFTKTDLVINGTGKLIINANYSDGIVSKDELKIINANIEINSEDDGIRGKDYAVFNNATININSGGDGIKSTNNEETELGYISIEGGNITINAKADGIQAETILNISGSSNIDITTSGSVSSSSSSEFSGFGRFGGSKGGYTSSSTSSDDSSSSKGLKAGKEITIENGNISISSTDDSIHSNDIIVINNGDIKISSSDDGIHADTNIVINNGNINIDKSYEGIESSYIEINGGIINLVASDDGINISGGNDSSSMNGRPGQNNFSNIGSSNQKLVINNGNITVNATGDGLDANGAIYINGGTIIVKGPTSGGNGVLDYDSRCNISGGNVIIYGSIGMWQNPTSDSTQYCLTFQTSGNSGDEIILKDSSGNVIESFTTEKSYGAILISNPDIQKGESYTLYKNNSSVGTIQANNIINTSNSSKGFYYNI